MQVVKHAAQVPCPLKNPVVVAGLPQRGPVVATLDSQGMVAGHLEAVDDCAQMDRDRLVDKQNEVQMVGHQLPCHDLNHGIIAGDILQRLQHSVAERAVLHHRRCDLAVAGNLAQKMGASCHDKGDHVDAPAPVVVANAPALHRRLGVACPSLLVLELLPVHFLLLFGQGVALA